MPADVGPPPPKRKRGGQPGNSNRTTHGLKTLRRRLNGAGLAKHDGRSALDRIKNDWKNEIRDARGELSPQEEVLLELAANTFIMVSSADAYILEHGVINKRRGTLRPVVTERGKLARTLRELLSDIGLARIEPKRDPLGELMERYAAKRAAEAQAARADDGEATPSGDA